MTVRKLLRIIGSGFSLLAALIASALACPQAAHAAGVVTTCDEAGLKSALFGGGKVTFNCSGTITLLSTIFISPNTTIDGSGHSVTISGGETVQIFVVNSGVTFNLNNITVAYGNSRTYGGGILNNGTAKVTHSTFMHNNSGYGGAIGNFGVLSVANSSFDSNGLLLSLQDIDSSYGGGIYNGYGGVLQVVNCSFDGNSALYRGGGIENSGSQMTVTASTFSNNSANTGGGIDNNDGNHMIVTNSTFYSNGYDQECCVTGGNISNFESNGDAVVILLNDTITGGFGGNVLNYSGSATLENTVVANPSGGFNCSGDIIDGGGNLRWPSSDFSCVGSYGDPMLGALAKNGGPTQTMALLPGSAALYTAVDALCPPTDQRGVIRPQGPHCDIGAYEANTAFSIGKAVSLQLIDFLDDLLSPPARRRLSERVITPLEQSLDSDLWLQGDANHINGSDVFTLQRDVVDSLSQFIVDPTQLTYIDSMVMADRTLAVVALNDKGCGANPNPAPNANVPPACAQAAAEVAAGDTSAGIGEYVEAIGHYLKAWQLTTP